MKVEQLYDLYLNASGVSTDSRHIKKGNLFFALSGPNFNGNTFAGDALDKGANYAVIDDPNFKISEKCIVVDNALQALQHLANYHRKKVKAKIIGITGSNGKTTSKELINTVLSTTYKTYATEGNLNNHIGVPLTLLRIKPEIEYAIIEMGANHMGEIKSYCKVAEPDYGIITNIGKAHIEGFGSLEGVKKAKSELYRFIATKRGGTAFVNLDHDYLIKLAKGINNVITYGTSGNADYRGQLTASDPFLEVIFYGSEEVEIKSQLIGNYNLENIILAATIGDYFNVPAGHIKKGIENYVPSNNRSQIIKKERNTIILDAYNANPSSVKVALESFYQQKSSKKVAIIGDMLELGKNSFTEHYEIAKQAEKMHLHKLALVGSEFAALEGKIDAHFFPTVADCKIWFDQQFFTDTTILIKGSRKIGLEKLVL